ncbi:hypothetical protein [Desulfosediminicola ganghwensis]|uniref:hypothetical protein n=1 Tax=Desulfosediminicola ganghwensis TaxID=2569540 RepID=UPI0010AC2AE4|nr:hypothetical protein [Desulfosediminicola ganghwensis]
MIKALRIRTTLFSLIGLMMMVFLSGCMGKSSSGAGDDYAAPADYGTVSATVADFKDIELPIDMTWNSDQSMAIKTESFNGGILSYSGRVELYSLKNFIISSMDNNKWKLVGEVQSKGFLLAFTKPNKTCMIEITEGFGGKYGSTTATLYITVDKTAAGKLNPFGEPVN